jgi:hypothetical protein
MKGCILAGRFVFSNGAKNTTRALRKTRSSHPDPVRKPGNKS